MTPQNFCYWLQGYFELSPANTLDFKQIQVIRNHLNLVKKCLAELQPAPFPGVLLPWLLPPVIDGGW